MPRGILRKRKRSAVDPCLGYYAEQQENTDIQTLGITNPVHPRSAFQAAPPRIVAFDQAVKSLARGSLKSLATRAKDVAAGNSFISVEGFLTANAKATTRRAEIPTTTGMSTFARLKHGPKRTGDVSTPRFATHRLSPIEFDVSPLRPQSAVDWAFDTKAPHTSGSIHCNEEHDKPQSEHGSLPDIAVLDSGSTSQDLGSPPPREEVTLRLRTRDIPRKDVLSLSGSESEPYTTDPDLSRPASQTPAKQTRKKRKSGKVLFKSLGTRLFEACVATHGNPTDSLVVPPQTGQTMTKKDEIEAERKPLPFIPVKESRGTPGLGSLVVNKKHILVDPHCTEPFRTAHFGPPMKLHGKRPSQEVASEIGQSLIVYKPLSKWQPKLDENSFLEAPSQKEARGRRKRGLQKEGQTPPEIAYAPLEFVPLSEALSTWKNRKSYRVPVENRTV